MLTFFSILPGSFLKTLINALLTDIESLPGSFKIIVNRVFLSTSVAIWVLFDPVTRSPSQCPVDLRLSALFGRVWIDTPLTILIVPRSPDLE